MYAETFGLFWPGAKHEMEDTYFKGGGGAGTTGLPAGDDPGVC